MLRRRAAWLNDGELREGGASRMEVPGGKRSGIKEERSIMIACIGKIRCMVDGLSWPVWCLDATSTILTWLTGAGRETKTTP